MEILKVLLENLLGKNIDGLLPVINLLKENSFDINKTLKNVKLENVLPIIAELLKIDKKTTPPSGGVETFTAPISTFADKAIITSLNTYFSS